MRIRAAAAVLATVSILATAGCAGAAASAPPTAGAPGTDSFEAQQLAAQAAPTPTPTPTALTVAAGTALTADQATLLVAGTAAYTLTDGSLVAVVKGQPVPAAVVADIQARALAKWPHGKVRTAPGGDAKSAAQLEEYDTWLRTIGHDMGGFMPIAVAPACAFSAPEVTLLRMAWEASYNTNQLHDWTEKAAVAKAQAYAATMHDAFAFPIEFPCY